MDSLKFSGFFLKVFLQKHFYIRHISIFTDIKYVFLPRKLLRRYERDTYGKYVLLRIPNLKIRIFTNVLRIFKFYS